MTAAAIASALGGHRNGDSWLTRCPAHDDGTPSLSLRERDGRLLVHCHAGCSQGDVIAALRTRGLWPGQASRSTGEQRGGDGHPPAGEPDQFWLYEDARGVVVRRTARWNRPGGAKDIRPQVPDSCGEWRTGEMAGPRPLYRLPELLSRPDAVVLVVEGEHAADSAAAILPDFVVTTSAGGARAARKTDWSPLGRRRIVVWPDADEPGRRYATDVAGLAQTVGALEVRIVELPGRLPAAWDLGDPLPPAWTVETVRELLEAAPAALNTASPPPDAHRATVADAISATGLDAITKTTSTAELEERMRALKQLATTMDPIACAALRLDLQRRFKAADIPGGTRLIDAAIGLERAADAVQRGQGRVLALNDPEPWPDAVDGAQMLDEIRLTLTRYVVLPEHTAEALSLWVLHTHAIESADVSPILAITSPQKRCGKTTVLELLACMVRRPLNSSSATPAALFRAVEAYAPTLLVDEADTFLADHGELRGILNSGHTRTSAQVLRTVGDDHEPRVFGTFGAKAIAAIGSLPGTIEDRAVIVRMQRRVAGERVERIRRDRIERELLTLRRKALRWAADSAESFRTADPPVPASLQDRAADNWRILLAIADAAGGDWPRLARAAAVALNPADDDDTEAGVMLLADLRDIFDAQAAERLESAFIAEDLAKLESRPWPEWHGKPLTVRGLARLLAPFGVRPKTIRRGENTAKGYDRADLQDAWTRYLSPNPRSTSVTPSQPLSQKDESTIFDPSHPIRCDGSENIETATQEKGCDVVTDQSNGAGLADLLAAPWPLSDFRARELALSAIAGRLGTQATSDALTPGLRSGLAAQEVEELVDLDGRKERTAISGAENSLAAAVRLRNPVLGEVWIVLDTRSLAEHPDIIRSGLPVFFYDELRHLNGRSAEELRAVAKVKSVFPTGRVLQ